eukprot:636843-Prymnesium_polylepis.1
MDYGLPVARRPLQQRANLGPILVHARRLTALGENPVECPLPSPSPAPSPLPPTNRGRARTRESGARA